MTFSPFEQQPTRPPVFAAHAEEPPTALYITLGPEHAVKIGTCQHCVVSERERPERAWDATGDQDLDFDRDTLLCHLAALGIHITDRQAYICP
jgi:hypothetical protein